MYGKWEGVIMISSKARSKVFLHIYTEKSEFKNVILNLWNPKDRNSLLVFTWSYTL